MNISKYTTLIDIISCAKEIASCMWDSNTAFKIYDFIFIAAIIFFFAVTCWVNIGCVKKRSKIFKDCTDESIQDARFRREIWLSASITWLAVYYFIVLSTFLSTSIVIYVSVMENNSGKVIFYSIISFFASVITYVINPQKISVAYRNAYMLIDSALVKNSGVQDAIIEGERVIAKGHK